MSGLWQCTGDSAAALASLTHAPHHLISIIHNAEPVAEEESETDRA